MELSTTLQIALLVAALALITLVACIVPLSFRSYRLLEQLLRAIEKLEADAKLLAHDSRKLLQNVNDLCLRANQQMDTVDEVMRTAHQWTQRVDRLVDQVGTAVEPPLFAFARNMGALRKGAATFLKVFKT